jgi:hypothetical protein
MFLKANIVNIKLNEEYDENCMFHPRFKSTTMFLKEMFKYYNIDVNVNVWSDCTGLTYKHNFKNFTFSIEVWSKLTYYINKNDGIKFHSLLVYNLDFTEVYISEWFDSFNKLKNPKPIYETYSGYTTKYFTKPEYVVTTFEEFRPCYEEIMKFKEDFEKKIELCDNLYEYYESLNIKENINNYNKQIKTLKDAKAKYKKKIISSTMKKIEIEKDFQK